MADDLREREPTRAQGDNPPAAGVRSDSAGTSGPDGGAAPGGAAVDRAEDRSVPAGSSSGSTGPGSADPLRDVEHATADE